MITHKKGDPMRYVKTMVLSIVIIFVLGLAASCSKQQQKPVPPPDVQVPTETQPEVLGSAETATPAPSENTAADAGGKKIEEGSKVPISNKSTTIKNWLTTEMTDTAGQTFTIGQYKGKNVLIHSFSVTCEPCEEQMQHIKSLNQMLGDNLVVISVDTNLDEPAQAAKEFAAENEFTWHVVPSSIDSTTTLLKKFGTKMLTQEKLPFALWCDSLRTKTFNGLKTTEQLQQEINKGCT